MSGKIFNIGKETKKMHCFEKKNIGTREGLVRKAGSATNLG